MDIQDLTTSRYGVAFALGLARALPPRAGYRVAYLLADFLALFKNSRMVQAVRLNQWVVHGMTWDAKQLDEAVHAVLRHGGHCNYDLYRNLHDTEAIRRLVHLDEHVLEAVRESQEGRAGYVVVGPHLSNFDLAIKAVGIAGVQAQILAIATPTSGYLWQNRMRAAPGVDISPITPRALLQAVDRLKNGGVVVTGVDRPVPGKKEMLNFFGQPAPLPTGHVRLAMDANVPVRVVAARMEDDGRYHVTLSERIPMQRTGHRKTDIRENAQRVLTVVERYIRERPLQWLMFYPVWPHLMDKVPRR
ncbi:MAG: lysophospholipid acyltransferase family protein [Chloroflexi bacterium]|nr:lysophospholipid acyltransferase family protein [Chloroflexota bacterium]